MSSLSHHGIKGQRWGVRRYQNKDGTLTREGQIRFAKNNLKHAKVRNLDKWGKSPDSNVLYIIGTSGSGKSTTAKGLAEDGDQVIHLDTIFEKENHGSPDSNKDFEAFLKANNVDISKASDLSISREERWQTYDAIGDLVEAYGQHCFSKGSKVVIEGVQMGDQTLYPDKNYFNGKPTVVLKGNIVRDTLRADRRDGVPLVKTVGRLTDRERWNWYKQVNATSNEIKYTSIGGTMYIEGNALILGDSSYLEHHGIRGQRWGVRRFQNRDGSLTNAGRKRLGYATKGAAQTVGKAFKAGVKAGGNAVKAVKAHHEKKEAEKLQKKKEKASKTRIGVMANKDLFTNEEIRKLNERFKLEDEMKMATLQKGVEIAKAVGTIAQNVGTVAKAYEDVTGTSLSPIKKAKQEAEAKEKAEDRKRKLAKEDAETKRAEDKEKRDIEDRERRIKLEDEDRVRRQAREDADAKRAENAEKRAQAKERRDSTMAVELLRKAKAAADEQEHKAVKAKADSRSTILDVLEKIDKMRDDDDHNNPPGGGIDTWNDDDYLNFFKKTGIIHSDISDPSLIQNGVLFIDSSDGLTHHGVKGQRWGVRRFQNPDGSLTEKGRKHYEKAIEKLDRKQVNSDNRRGALERQHPFAVTASAILTGSAYAALMIASAANPATIALGTSIVAAVSALGTHVDYSVAEAWEARGTKRRKKKRKEYEEMLNHDGMYHVENGTLFIDAGEPYLEHHGVLGMKWGKHLRAGKGPADASAGGGGGEDDEKLKEMAKKAGMSVAEYKQKFASKIGGAASKVGSAVYDAAGGSHKKNAEGWRKMAREESNAARASEKSAHENSARAASQDRKYGSGGDVYRRAAESNKEDAETHRSNAKGRSERAASEQATYEKSLAGRYDKMKADRARSKKIKQRQSIERALSNGPVEAKPKKSLGKRLEDKLGVTHERTNKPKQSKEAKRIEGMFKAAARKDKAFSGTSPKEKKRAADSAMRIHNYEAGREYSKYRHSLAGRYDEFKAKRKKKAKHFDNTNAVYTEGTRLVINSKWG